MGFRLDLEKVEELIPDRSGKDFEVNLRECDFARPEGILGLFLLLRHLIREGVKTRFIRPQNPDVDSYIERTGVYARTIEDVIYEPHADDIIMRTWGNPETMQALTAVTDQEQVGGIVERFALALEKQLRKPESVLRLKSAMIETFQNMPEHANPRNPKEFEGYTNVQSYMNGGRVVVAAGDLGYGIRRSLQTSPVFSRSIMSDLEAIQKAVFEKASRYIGLEKSLEHGGGLHRATDIVKKLKGATVIRSGCAALIIRPFQEPRALPGLKYFPGTQITITVSTP